MVVAASSLRGCLPNISSETLAVPRTSRCGKLTNSLACHLLKDSLSLQIAQIITSCCRHWTIRISVSSTSSTTWTFKTNSILRCPEAALRLLSRTIRALEAWCELTRDLQFSQKKDTRSQFRIKWSRWVSRTSPVSTMKCYSSKRTVADCNLSSR